MKGFLEKWGRWIVIEDNIIYVISGHLVRRWKSSLEDDVSKLSEQFMINYRDKLQ